ncbi:MAG: phosphoribosylanthranilate isomerase [Alphaproteobacteria bacterium]|nr:phosphoribosylanthranilate isomerase [Alphaproteobacteria bacterium]
MTIEVKICGLTTREAVAASAAAGARYGGLVFYRRSPRFLTTAQARELALAAPANLTTVGLFVDPPDDELHGVLDYVPLRMIQLHGSEPPARVADIKNTFGLPVMKAIPVAAAEDLAAADAYLPVADRLLFDAKPPAGTEAMPGGNARAFDWRLLAGLDWAKPWMLAGGLTPENAAEAVRISGAKGIDVSSGVEDRPGHKDINKIKALMQAVAAL